jgi:hypothetical protein
MENAIVDVLAAVLRDDERGVADLAELPADAVRAEAVRHGVAPLIDDRLAGRSGVPGELRRLFREEARREAATDVVRDVEIVRLLGVIAERGVEPIVFKGAHLARSHYPRASLRPQLDTDILIPESARSIVHDAMGALGYGSDAQVAGDLVKHQRTYVRQESPAVQHVVDVHWRVSNRQLFASVLSYEDLVARAVPVPGLPPGVRGPADEDALLLAAIHRVAHHADLDRLIWIYDIDLLARRLDETGWARLAARAVERGIAVVTASSLAHAVDRLGSPVPPDLVAALRSGASAGEPTAAYTTFRGQFEVLTDNLRALPTWSARRRLIREHLFPPADYIRRVYAPSSTAPLPVLYAWRVLRGAPVWIVQSWSRARRRRLANFK